MWTFAYSNNFFFSSYFILYVDYSPLSLRYSSIPSTMLRISRPLLVFESRPKIVWSDPLRGGNSSIVIKNWQPVFPSLSADIARRYGSLNYRPFFSASILSTPYTVAEPVPSELIKSPALMNFYSCID